MSQYFRAITSIVLQRPDNPAVKVEVDVAYGPLVTEPKRAENLIRAYKVIEPDNSHRMQEVVYDQEAQPRDLAA
jgi:hypothetical protein